MRTAQSANDIIVHIIADCEASLSESVDAKADLGPYSPTILEFKNGLELK